MGKGNTKSPIYKKQPSAKSVGWRKQENEEIQACVFFISTLTIAILLKNCT